MDTAGGGGVSRSFPAPLPNCEPKGREAVNEVAELDEQDEAAESPVAPQEPTDEEQAEEEAHEAEQTADEPEEAPKRQEAQEAEREARMNKAEARFGTYTAKITEYWGDEAIHLVPFNLDPGAPPGFLDTRNAGHVEDTTKAAAMEFLGFPREQDYQPDPEARMCDACKGKTKTKTGSVDPQFATRTCPACKGYGYTINGRAPSEVDKQSNGNVTLTPVAVEPLVSGDFDAWNQPRILPTGVPNPNYGRTPDHWIHVEPWGDTRGLTAQDVRAGV